MDFNIATMGFDQAWWEMHWWLIFPIFGFAIAFFSIWLQHRRNYHWMRVMQTYAEKGKDPPASLSGAAPDDWHGHPYRYYGSYGRRSPYWDARRGIFLGVLAGAFAYLYYHNGQTDEGFGIVAVILGALAVSSILMSLVPRPRTYDLPPKPDDK